MCSPVSCLGGGSADTTCRLTPATSLVPVIRRSCDDPPFYDDFHKTLVDSIDLDQRLPPVLRAIEAQCLSLESWAYAILGQRGSSTLSALTRAVLAVLPAGKGHVTADPSRALLDDRLPITKTAEPGVPVLRTDVNLVEPFEDLDQPG